MLREMVMTGFLVVGAGMAGAAPQNYRLDPDRSVVNFGWQLGPDHLQGSMSILAADLKLDFRNLQGCRINVTLDATHVEAGFPFATQALRGPKMLDAAQFAQIVFASRSVRAEPGGARVEGDLTLRGVTRPVVLHATFHGKVGADPSSLPHLQVLLTGSLQRSDFGATGWADMVGDPVQITILAALDTAP